MSAVDGTSSTGAKAAETGSSQAEGGGIVQNTVEYVTNALGLNKPDESSSGVSGASGTSGVGAAGAPGDSLAPKDRSGTSGISGGKDLKTSANDTVTGAKDLQSTGGSIKKDPTDVSSAQRMSGAAGDTSTGAQNIKNNVTSSSPETSSKSDLSTTSTSDSGNGSGGILAGATGALGAIGAKITGGGSSSTSSTTTTTSKDSDSKGNVSTAVESEKPALTGVSTKSTASVGTGGSAGAGSNAPKPINTHVDTPTVEGKDGLNKEGVFDAAAPGAGERSQHMEVKRD